MQIDKEKIKKRIVEIGEALSEIKRITSLSDKEFWSDKEHIAAVKYYLLQTIEGVGSVCLHIVAKKYNKAVTIFGECFERLAEEGFLNQDLAGKLRKMVGFRNKLVHQYWQIDDKKVLQYSREDLKDIQDFMRFVKKELLK